jgi:hypothetical protein
MDKLEELLALLDPAGRCTAIASNLPALLQAA